MEAICEMSTIDIKEELRVRQFELLDPSVDGALRRWTIDRVEALLLELNNRE